MGLRRKQILEQQKAEFEEKLLMRLAYLSKKNVPTAAAEKDTIIRKWKAAIKASKRRLGVLADYDKKAAELAKAKADKAAGAAKEEAGGKAEKPKKAPEAGKEKKAKGEGKAAQPKAAEGGKGHKKPESGEDKPAG